MFNLEELKVITPILEQQKDSKEVSTILIKLHKAILDAENCKECLWEFYWDCGRQGNLEGTFRATKEEVESIIGKKVYFGEVLGKHSEIFGEIESGDITLISDDPVKVMGSRESGYNPFAYLPEDDEE